MHEAKLYERNCFITLTYDEAHVPEHGNLRYVDFQKFMKRLRRRFFSSRIRFYMCGEYGEGFLRPHYHACLFNFDFADKLYFKRAGSDKLYTSGELQKLWPFGFSLIGSVTFESAAYVARYCTEKVNGDAADNHYRVVDSETGEVVGRRVPEFSHMSLRPGIGKPFFDRFVSDIYPAGRCVVNGKLVNPPRTYDRWYRRICSGDEHQLMVEARMRAARENFADNSDERLAVKEQVAAARAALFRKSL